MIPIPKNLLSLLEQFPLEIQEKIITGWSQSRSIVSFRVNHLKSSTEEVTEALKNASLPYQKYIFSQSPAHSTSSGHPLSQGGNDTDAFYLPIDQEYTLRGLDIYREGKIYVQSLSSMIPAVCLDLQPGQKILDMASAPGSKTTQIASILKGKCQITALEKFGIRHEKLLYTLKLQGAEECVEVIKMDALNISFGKEMPTKEAEDLSKNKSPSSQSKFSSPFTKGAYYDRILLDAPCSSDGRINLADEKTHKWYSGEKSKSKAELQLQMLETAGKLLSPTGRIVYSTCSLTRGENEKVVKAFLRKYPEFQTLPCTLGGDYTLKEYPELSVSRWLPTQIQEGFFVCLLEKKL